jgi:hypothetical protein
MKSVLAIAVLILFASYAGAQEEKTSDEAVAKLKTFSDQQLKQCLERPVNTGDFRDDSLYEPCLNEIVRRGGKTWETILSAKVEKERGSYDNLELLTALRRVQKKPDPILVIVDVKGPLVATPLSLPKLKAKITNRDSEKSSVGYRNGGDYRSGRQGRWRIVVRDDKGTELPVRGPLSWIRGGVYREDFLKFGESWETVLDVGSFVRIPQPGTYSLEVLYHNKKAIADESEIGGLIVSRAKPISLIVRPLVIELSLDERKQAARWIAALNANQRLKVVAGTYGEWAHKLVSPNSPEGKILGMGIKAVPTLVDSLADKSLSDKKRAWILALLFSATGENDPRDFSALGEYDYQEAGWQISGNKSGEMASGGLGISGIGSFSGGKIDHEAQDRLIGVWESWLKKVDVRQATNDGHLKPAATSNTR